MRISTFKNFTKELKSWKEYNKWIKKVKECDGVHVWIENRQKIDKSDLFIFFISIRHEKPTVYSIMFIDTFAANYNLLLVVIPNTIYIL